MDVNSRFLLFSGSSHPEFANSIAKHLGVSLGKVIIEKFPDKEIGVQILENVRGRDVFVLQTIAHSPNSYLMELLIFADALKRASARSIVAVIPYYGYGRQDRKEKGRVSITAKLIANLLEKAGITRVLTMDLHSEPIQGFFDIPLDNLHAQSCLAAKIKELQLENPLVVAPDLGSVNLVKRFAKELKTDFVFIDKQRVSLEEVHVVSMIGSAKGRDVIIADDMISTGQTIMAAAKFCKQAGANRVIAAATHGLFIGPGCKDSAIDHVIVSDSIPILDSFLQEKLVTVSVAPIFAQAIHSIVMNESISCLN